MKKVIIALVVITSAQAMATGKDPVALSFMTISAPFYVSSYSIYSTDAQRQKAVAKQVLEDVLNLDLTGVASVGLGQLITDIQKRHPDLTADEALNQVVQTAEKILADNSLN